jgi:hypothetical protein
VSEPVSRPVPCRSCGAPIRFIEVPTSGKKMPVDADRLTEFLLDEAGLPRVILVTERGLTREGRRASLTTPGAEPVEGYTPHWATCTEPSRWRRRRS